MNAKKADWTRWNVDGACDAGINSTVDGITENVAEKLSEYLEPFFGNLPGVCLKTVIGGFESLLDEDREEIFGDAANDLETHLQEVRNQGWQDALESGEYIPADSVCEYGYRTDDEYNDLESEKEELEERVEELENSVPICPCCGEEMEFNRVQELYRCTGCVREFKFQEV